MMNMKRNILWLGMLAMVLTFTMTVTACDDGSGSGGGGGIPSALVGKWYSKADPDTLMFEITSAGKITLNSANSDTLDLTVSGNTGELKSGSTVVGTFDYSISNGELSITNATGVMIPFTYLSPLIKKGGSTPGGDDGGEPVTPGGDTYTVTFSANGATSGTAPTAMTVTPGQDITLPGAGSLAKNGSSFGGWNVNSAGTGTTYQSGDYYTPSGNVTLYAKWNGGGQTNYTVTFNANGATSGTAPTAMTVTPGYDITLPGANSLAKTGSFFNGWSTSTAGTGTAYQPGDSFTPAGNVTLYAKWNVGAPNTFTVIFDLNGISGPEVPASRTVQPGGSITLLAIESQSAYVTFTGWNTAANGSGTNYAAYASYTPAGASAFITLYAQWDIVSINSLTSFAAKLAWLEEAAQSNTSYILEVDADEDVYPQQSLNLYNRTNTTITLRGVGANRTISGCYLGASAGVTLVLDSNITIAENGVSASGGSLIMNAGSAITGGSGVYVGENGTFTMNGGTISDGQSTGYGGGVYVFGGTFTMNDGTISDNRVGYTWTCYGGGVYVEEGTFIMNGGTISGNTVNATAYALGGGVYVSENAIFTMKGGTITENTVDSGNSFGGGVYVDGTFTMSGGTISSNTAPSSGGGVHVSDGTFTMSGTAKISGNTAATTTSIYYINGGGGVHVSDGTFTMNGGEISGNTSALYGGGVNLEGGTFTMRGGIISGNIARENGGGLSIDTWEGSFTKTGGTITGYLGDTANGNAVRDSSGNIVSGKGHAVYASYPGSGIIKRKEITAGSGDNLSFNCSETGNTFSGAWDY